MLHLKLMNEILQQLSTTQQMLLNVYHNQLYLYPQQLPSTCATATAGTLETTIVLPARPNVAVTFWLLANVNATPLTVVPKDQVVEPASLVTLTSIPAMLPATVVTSAVEDDIVIPDQVPETVKDSSVINTNSSVTDWSVYANSYRCISTFKNLLTSSTSKSSRSTAVVAPVHQLILHHACQQ